MNTITIPRKLIKEKELVIIPRREYEKLLIGQTAKQEKIKRSASFRVPKKHERFYEKLDQELTECLKDYENGSVIGSFSSVKEIRQSLEK